MWRRQNCVSCASAPFQIAKVGGVVVSGRQLNIVLSAVGHRIEQEEKVPILTESFF